MLQKETSGYKWNNIKYTGLLSVMCESPETYASIAFAVVWISK